MPNIGPIIAASANLGIGYAERLLAGIPSNQFGSFARVGDQVIQSNHPAFTFGHLSLYGSRIVRELGQDATAIETPESYSHLFSKDAQCVDDPDGSIYPDRDELAQRLLASYRTASEAIASSPDEVFLAPNPNEAMRSKFPTVGAMHAFYVGGHFMMHMGQLSAWRRAMGMPPA